MTEVNKLFLPRATERHLRKSCMIFSFKHCPIVTSLRRCLPGILKVHFIGNGADWGLLQKFAVWRCTVVNSEGTFDKWRHTLQMKLCPNLISVSALVWLGKWICYNVRLYQSIQTHAVLSEPLGCFDSLFCVACLDSSSITVKFTASIFSCVLNGLQHHSCALWQRRAVHAEAFSWAVMKTKNWKSAFSKLNRFWVLESVIKTNL